MHEITELTPGPPLRPDALRTLRKLADGTPPELVNTRSLYLLKKLGYVQWSETFYGRELSAQGRALAADLEAQHARSHGRE